MQMKPVTRWSVMAAAAVVMALGVAPAAQASNPPQNPPDCTAYLDGQYAVSLTCTSRPPTQQWRVFSVCYPFGRPVGHYGNIVTGNGTSSYNCYPVPGGDVAYFSIYTG